MPFDIISYFLKKVSCASYFIALSTEIPSVLHLLFKIIHNHKNAYLDEFIKEIGIRLFYKFFASALSNSAVSGFCIIFSSVVSVSSFGGVVLARIGVASSISSGLVSFDA